jgi:hypothetical protein
MFSKSCTHFHPKVENVIWIRSIDVVCDIRTAVRSQSHRINGGTL